MKILWVVNIILPSLARKLNLRAAVFGGWLESALQAQIAKGRDIFAVATIFEGREIVKHEIGEISFYLIPRTTASLTRYPRGQSRFWSKLLTEVRPDLIHIHGTEYPHALACLEAAGSVIPSVISIQGLIGRIAQEYFGGLERSEVRRCMSIRDILKGDSLLKQQASFLKRASFEYRALEMASGIIGRTAWDRATTRIINPNATYYHCNESIRDCFYGPRWSLSEVKKHTIFVSQASYPIKGFHMLLKAAAFLKSLFPDLKVNVSGPDIVKAGIRTTGYGRFIRKRLEELNLADCVIFLGLLSGEDMCNAYLEAHTFVLPSAIENSSNSLGEAMLLGVPCVCSDVGGISSLIRHEEEGFLYPFSDTNLLAHWIARIWDDDSLANSLSAKAREKALRTHDKVTNAEDLSNIYAMYESASESSLRHGVATSRRLQG